MKTTMTSRERLAAAIALEAPDHVPLWCLWSHDRDPYNRKDNLARAEAILALGMDDTLWLHAPWRVSPEVVVSAWSEPVPGKDYTHMYRRYETPAGAVENILRSSEYLDDPGKIGVLGDLNMSHGLRFLVETREDLGPVRYLLSDPGRNQRFLKPLLKKEVEMVHQAGVSFSYIMTKGIMPLLDDFLDIGIDVLWGPDPVQGEADLPALGDRLKGRVCIWGGMNAILTLGEGTPQEARDAVEEAIRTLAPGGGFVLFPVDQIVAGTPWENIEAMLERWCELASYPIQL